MTKTMHEVMEFVSSKKKEIKELNKEINSTIKEFCSRTNTDKDFFAGEANFAIVIRGYTPSFNDGDPCEHDSYFETDSNEYREFFDEISEHFFDYETDKANDFYETIERNISKNVKKFVKLLEDYYEDKFGTDYEIFLMLEDGKLNIYENDCYDCGF